MSLPQSVLIQEGDVAQLFASSEETSTEVQAYVVGEVPHWLRGVLLRVGPGKFEWGEHKYKHWFDGEAIVHRFKIDGSKIFYSSRFIRSQSFLLAEERNRIVKSGFVTFAPPDPCADIFKRLVSTFLPSSRGDNSNVSLINLHGEIWATTESSAVLHRVNEESLDTVSSIDCKTLLQSGNKRSWMAHPHIDEDGGLVLVSTNYDLQRVELFRLSTSSEVRPGDGSQLKQSLPEIQIKALGSLPYDGYPAYYHSFGMTPRYFVLFRTSVSIQVSAWKIIQAYLLGSDFLDMFHFDENRRGEIIMIERKSGMVRGRFSTDPLFLFHHINSYEHADQIIIDVCAYQDSRIVRQFYLHELRQGHQGNDDAPKFASAELRRYYVPLRSSEFKETAELPRRASGKDHEVIFCGIEMPTINYKMNGAHYKFAYGLGQSCKDTYYDQLVKVNTESHEVLVWREEGWFPSEPSFVQTPGREGEEDAGVLLSSLTCPKKMSTYLLILDAITMKEIGRATIPLIVRSSLHGNFWPDIKN